MVAILLFLRLNRGCPGKSIEQQEKSASQTVRTIPNELLKTL